METVERNVVPGRGEMLSQGHLLWVGSSNCLLLVRRTLEPLAGGGHLVAETSSVTLGSRVLGHNEDTMNIF